MTESTMMGWSVLVLLSVGLSIQGLAMYRAFGVIVLAMKLLRTESYHEYVVAEKEAAEEPDGDSSTEPPRLAKLTTGEYVDLKDYEVL